MVERRVVVVVVVMTIRKSEKDIRNENLTVVVELLVCIPVVGSAVFYSFISSFYSVCVCVRAFLAAGLCFR